MSIEFPNLALSAVSFVANQLLASLVDVHGVYVTLAQPDLAVIDVRAEHLVRCEPGVSARGHLNIVQYNLLPQETEHRLTLLKTVV